MPTKSKTPQIRFQGFDENWDNLEFFNTFENISNNNLSRAELNYESGQVKNIHYGDVLIKFSELLDIEKDEIPFISNDDFVSKYKSSKLQNGDVIIADAAEDETVGKCTEIINLNGEIVFSGLHTIAIRPTKSFASKYLGYYMNSPSYHNQLIPLLQGTKVLSISKSAIRNTNIFSPSDILEQTKIGNYFQQLDKLIEQKQMKHQKLKQFKKAMLDKMFPKDGADTPEIRFKGFGGKWEEKILDEIVNRYDNLRVPISSSNRISGTTPYYGANGIQGYVKGYTHDGEFILVAEDGANDLKNYPVQYVNGKIWVNNHAHVLQAKKDIADNKFLKYAISKINIEPFLVGGGRAKLNANIMMNINMTVPIDIEEQLKLGKYFQKLDKQIDLQQKELEKLKNIKKALLDKMFV